MRFPSSCFVVFLLLSAYVAAENLSSSCQDESETVRLRKQQGNSVGLFLELQHINGPCSPLGHLPRATPAEVLFRDDLRVQGILSRLTKAGSNTATSSGISPQGDLWDSKGVSTPLTPGNTLGVGNYIIRIGLGTPSGIYAMVFDTGSSLSWVQCKPCLVKCHRQQGPLFNPNASSTYSTLVCSAAECRLLQAATLNPSRCTAAGICVYDASYGDGSISLGYLSRESLTLGSAVVSGFVFGCGQNNQGLFGQTGGLLGFDKGKLSAFSQLGLKYGNAFSYCLPTSASTGFLSVGDFFYAGGNYSFTPLVNGPVSSLYFIKLAAVTVAGNPISVPSSVQTLIDSGTVITRLPSPVYKALSRAMVAALPGCARAAGDGFFDTCFKGSQKTLPPVSVKLVFGGGAELDLPPANIFYDIRGGSVACLGFAATSGSVAIIGNRQQQTFKVAYDVAGSRIGFACGGCS